MATDPVCKMAIAPEKAAAKMDHAGTTYYFCSESCRKKFMEHPQNYVGTETQSAHSHSGHRHG